MREIAAAPKFDQLTFVIGGSSAGIWEFDKKRYFQDRRSLVFHPLPSFLTISPVV